MYIFYFVTIAAVVFIVQKILFWLFLLQQNNYSFTKTLKYLSKRGELAPLFFGWENILHILLIVLYFMTLIESRSSVFYSYAVTGFFGLYFARIITAVVKGKIQVPRFTPEVLIVFAAVFGLSCLLLLFPILDDFFWYLFIAKLVPLFVIMAVWVLSIPRGFYMDFLIMRSSQKIEKTKKLKTIVILGDNETVQINNILFQFLNQSSHVVQSSGVGTVFDISKTVFKKIKSDTEFLIVDINIDDPEELIEMGQVLAPDICIINYSSGQVPRQRTLANFLAILPRATQIISIPEKLTSHFVEIEKHSPRLNKKLSTKKITIHKSYASFIVHISRSNTIRIKTKLLIPRTIQSLLIAIYIGLEEKMSKSQIARNALAVSGLPGFMEFAHSSKNAALINNSANHDIEASKEFIAAARGIVGKKYLVLSFSNEFGKRGKRKYYDFGKEMAKHVSSIFAIDSTYESGLKAGVLNAKKKTVLHFTGKKETISGLKKKLKKNDVCIFVGEKTAEVFHELIADQLH